MGVSVFVAVEREFDGYDASSVMGKPLAAAMEPLDGACDRLGVPNLSSFVSMDPARLEDFASAEPAVTSGEGREQLNSLRAAGGGDAEQLDDLEALMDLTEGVDANAPPMAEQWFEPGAALVSIRALLAWLQDPTSQFKAKPFTRGDVIADLQSVEQVLAAASQAAVRFHFEYDV